MKGCWGLPLARWLGSWWLGLDPANNECSTITSLDLRNCAYRPLGNPFEPTPVHRQGRPSPSEHQNLFDEETVPYVARNYKVSMG